jgi:exodeoxyribonuclease VII large subunit
MRQFSVSELFSLLNRLVSNELPDRICVTGEAVGVSSPRNGHIYFTLMDSAAKIRCVYFKGSILRGAFIPKDGDKVEVVGEARVYPPDGSFQIIVRQIKYNSEGDYWKAFAELREKLEKEGLFDSSRKRLIEKYPKRVALLTAENGAAVKDFLVTAQAKSLFFSVYIYPIPVQGAANAPIIAEKIAQAGSGGYDALVLTRGGGALEDLAVFNDERVVRALAASKVPTISAIGHEHDITICDYAADQRVATPTAAAEFLTREYLAAGVLVEKYFKDITKSLKKRLEIAIITVDRHSALLYSGGIIKRLENCGFSLDNTYQRMTSRLREFIIKNDNRLSLQSARLAVNTPDRRLSAIKASLSTLCARLKSAAFARQNEFNFVLKSFEERLRLTDPERLLAAGYSIVYKEGKVIDSIAAVSAGDAVTVRLKDGELGAVVETKH